MAQTAADSLAQTATTMIDDNSSDEQSDIGADSVVGQIHYKLQVNGNGSTGNTNLLLFQTNGALDYNISKNMKVFTSPAFAYGTQENQMNLREYYDDIRLAILHQHRFYYLLYGSYQKSFQRQIKNRWTMAGGWGYKVLNKNNFYATISNVFLFENTDYQILDDRKLWRNSTRFTGDYYFYHNKMSLVHTLYFQPAITEKNNIRMRAILAVNYKISSLVGIHFVVDDSYETYVVPNTKTNDFRWTFGFTFEQTK